MSIVKIDGMDKAILGVAVGSNYDNRMVYSIERIVDQLMKQNEWDSDTAWEFFDFNIARGVSARTLPYWFTRITSYYWRTRCLRSVLM